MTEVVRGTARALLVFIACACVVALTALAATSNTPSGSRATPAVLQASTQPEQTSTLLSNGDRLLLGGRGASGQVSARAIVVDAASGKAQLLSGALNVPRARHSASVLPDGTVLIVGGVNSAGQPVAEVERYHPDSGRFENLGDIGLSARSEQSATLLSDGRLLIVGGTDVSSQVHADAVLLDPSTLNVVPVTGGLVQARSGQEARLLPSGDVLISGGHDQGGQPLRGAELWNVASGAFQPLDAASAAAFLSQIETAGAPAVSASYPANASGGVAVDAQLALRFSRPLQPQSLTDQTVTLFGPTGPVEATVVVAEGGMLAFVTPRQQLFPGTRYTLFVKGARDARAALPLAAVGFETARVARAATAAQPLVLQKQYIAPADSDGEMWLPGKRNLTGVWRSGQAALARSHIPNRRSLAHQLHNRPGKGSLPEAPAGVTAIAGQVLRLNGAPLPNATLSIGSRSVKTDASGEFLLTEVAPGTQVLVIDGSTADEGKRQYGRYEYRAIIEAGKTNALPFVIWMTRLDVRNAMTVSSPTTAETIISNPRIPGLELRIPAGTVIRDSRGRNVTELTMTAIPVDQPPFPLPNKEVPVYFTVQPGSAHLQGLNVQAARGARLIYPNFSNSPAGSRIDFWNYDPREKGWYVYGQGTVSSDRKQVIPDAGVVIYEFTGAMIALPSTAPAEGPPPSDGNSCDADSPNAAASVPDPVDCYTGLFIHKRVDLSVPDVLPIEVLRTYRPRDSASRAFGIGATLAYDIFLVGDTIPWTYQDLILPDGGRVHYVRTSSGTEYRDAVYGTTAPGPFYGSVIRWNAAIDSGWVLTLRDGTAFTFPDSYQSASARCAATVGMKDRYGNALVFARDSNCNLTSVTSPNGRRVTFTYDTSNRVIQAVDDIGRTVTYQYDTGGRLSSATNAGSGSESYAYDSSNRMLTVTDGRGNVMVTNVYDTNGRVSQQTYADGTTAGYSYTLNGSGVVTQMDYTNERGVVRRTQFAAGGLPSSISYAFGQPEQQVISFTRDPSTHLAQTVTDPLGRVTAYQYDSKGNVTHITRLSGTPDANTWTLTYEPTFSRLATVTDPLNRTTTYAYDTFGNLTSIADPLGHVTTMQYNGAGLLTSATKDPSGLATTVAASYSGGDVTAVTDAMNRTTSFFRDGVGRVRSIRDALGNMTLVTYDALDRVTQSKDALGNTVNFTYDANGNLLTVQDPRGNVTTFAYDVRNRLSSMTDSLNHVVTYQYDAAGNGTRVTDRNGRVSGYSYDKLNRLTSAGFGATVSNPTAYTRTIAYTWDGGNRVTQAADSVSGTVIRSLDALDRLTEEQSPQGTIGYTYYANGLRQSMTVQGQSTVNYTYDAASRLTQVAKGSATVGFTYDALDRRATLTLPNGVQVGYAYDPAGQLTALTYQNGATSIGNLTYSYDAAGRRTGAGGSLARISLPSAISSSAYDAGNRLTTWGAEALTYDGEGNLLTFGSRTYSWNVRNQLMSTSEGSGTYGYDAFGRRNTKTVGGVTTGYVHDGLNPVLAGNDFLLGGLGVDDVYARINSSGTSSLLTDALGSTIALTDASGSTTASFSYEAFGKSTHTGSDDTAFRFTRREDDGATGLDYMRARYYSPSLGRFISEDPAGFNGDGNLYAYADGNPTAFVDPFGLSSLIFDPGSGNLTVLNRDGVPVGSYPAGNNTDSRSRGPWPPGTYPYQYHRPHTADPNGPYGSYGNYVFNLPGCQGCGVHAGRESKPDGLGRKGVKHATEGCIRATDPALKLITDLVNAGDPLTSLTVSASPVPTNLPPFDSSIPGGPKPYLPDLR